MYEHTRVLNEVRRLEYICVIMVYTKLATYIAAIMSKFVLFYYSNDYII